MKVIFQNQMTCESLSILSSKSEKQVKNLSVRMKII